MSDEQRMGALPDKYHGLSADQRAVLVNLIDPKRRYPVTYTIGQDGERKNEHTMLFGSDLTEPQIAELWITHPRSFIPYDTV